MAMEWYNKLTEEFVSNGYFHDGATIYDRIDTMSKAVGEEFQNEELGRKIKDYIEKGFYVIPTPVWSNYGTNRGGGVSCFGTYIGDSVKSILKGLAEIGMMCKVGGGTSGYFDLRGEGTEVSTGGLADGPMYFLEMFNMTKTKINQGTQRRGEFAAFFEVEHPDILKILEINREGCKIQRQPYGICISNVWMDDMEAGNLKNRVIWAKILENRQYTGFPYLFFKDNVNNNTVDIYKDLKMTIKATQMCTEILLPSSEKESFTCNIMAMNLTKYDEWKNTDAVELAVYFTDAVLSDFIRRYRDNELLERAVRFAENHRAIGIGASGYHSYLQSHMIPFESLRARQINIEIFKTIQERCYKASEEMGIKYGQANILKGTKYTRRHTTLTAIAPNTSSSFIMGQHSQSIEPWVSNYYIKKLAKMKHSVKNIYLEKLLEEKGKNTNEVWDSILMKGGSVMHLDFLSEDEKAVFRTFGEISQLNIIQQAASRQKYIDQGQSLNLMIHPSIPTRDVNKLYLEAYKLGIKTLYYHLTTSASQEFIRDVLSCENCAG